jgi:hypothetical protein
MTYVLGNNPEGKALRSPSIVFTAETNLEASPQLGVPENMTGKLVSNLTLEQFLQFTSEQDVEVGFEGRGYEFSKVEKDGTFELTKK